MPKLSAGLLLYRVGAGAVDVLIAHPGGPFWARKDDGAWSIPKGEYDDGDDPWEAAQREFAEELGLAVPDGPRIDLGTVKQPSGKVVTVFAVGSDLDITDAHSNTFEMEWPRGSGKLRQFPEIDRVDWFPVTLARTKLLKGQHVFLDRLMAYPDVGGHVAEGEIRSDS
ncbi:NUDIX domain-containing protein [Mycobacterium asiaticum]|uniref:NTP pyrophosphohydrolase n=1 Tax=Mycobacterium asiaticum TaxID=1790 RepID=A0A1A3N9N2_MYCAS|nr:NUDIX domain-containing protein [Mycobacterium asiaticum]OBK17082.1 NTP pyrophosphohydrolase [Mycobacterium asiaticum]